MQKHKLYYTFNNIFYWNILHFVDIAVDLDMDLVQLHNGKKDNQQVHQFWQNQHFFFSFG